jgi:hypothetical protein
VVEPSRTLIRTLVYRDTSDGVSSLKLAPLVASPLIQNGTDTGSRSFVCETYERSFNRRDSLLRPNKLHSRSNNYPTSVALTPDADITPFSADRSPDALQQQSVPEHDEPPLPTYEVPLGDLLDFDAPLIWPDIEKLFQCIPSTEPINHLPAFTASSFSHSILECSEKTRPKGGIRNIHEKPRSIEDIPQGASQQALPDVGQMVSAQVSTAPDACISSANTDTSQCL